MTKLIKISLFFMFFISLAYQPARGTISIGFGPEYFLWREYNTNGSKALDESGFRGALSFYWEQNTTQGFLFGYAGKLYAGNVAYNGQTLFPPYKPVTTDTSYLGFQNEGIVIFRQLVQDPAILDLVTSLGWDHWTRNINPGNSNQLEDYDIFFLKFGPLFSFHQMGTPSIGFGAKFPVMTFENAHLNSLGFNQNPILHPGRQISFYVNLGYRFYANWEGQLYYDSYRFSESAREIVTSSTASTGTVYQPQSAMDVFGARAVYHFP